AALPGDHATVALVAGRGAAGVPLDGDQGATFLDRLDDPHVVDRIRVAGELEEDEVTRLGILGQPLAALHVPVAHDHGRRRLRDQRAAPGLGQHPPHEDRAPGDAVPTVGAAVLLLVAVRRALGDTDLAAGDVEHPGDAHDQSSGIQSGSCGGWNSTSSNGASFSVLTSGPYDSSRCERSSCSTGTAALGSTAGNLCTCSASGRSLAAYEPGDGALRS